MNPIPQKKQPLYKSISLPFHAFNTYYNALHKVVRSIVRESLLSDSSGGGASNLKFSMFYLKRRNPVNDGLALSTKGLAMARISMV
jgi:hypothetical protein